jgi:peptidoglycan/xylan/chitin deacetylase (PgdA/CDA1 family)
MKKSGKRTSKVALTIDVEQDAPPLLNTWRGTEEGVPLLLDVLNKYDVPATFFVTGLAAEKFPQLIIYMSQAHEVSCHGYEHERFDMLVAEEQRKRIGKATKILGELTGKRPPGFRSPNFKLGTETLAIVEEMGYVYDASRASYKLRPRRSSSALVEIPNTLPSSFLRIPPWLSQAVLRFCLSFLPVVVLDYHPWELIRMSGIRFDLRFSTGERALRRLGRTIRFLRGTGTEFVTMEHVARIKLASL